MDDELLSLLRDVLLIVRTAVTPDEVPSEPVNGLLIPTVAATLAIRAGSGAGMAERVKRHPRWFAGGTALALGALFVVAPYLTRDLVLDAKRVWNGLGVLLGNVILAWPDPATTAKIFIVKNPRVASLWVALGMLAFLMFGHWYVMRTEYAAHFAYVYVGGFLLALVGPWLFRVMIRVMGRRS